MISLLIAAAVSASASQAVTVGQFLARAEPLLGRSPMTLMFSSDAKALMKMIGEAAKQNRAQREADRAAGRPPIACLPPQGKARLDAKELVSYLQALPANQRGRNFNDAFSGFVAHKYPCRA